MAQPVQQILNHPQAANIPNAGPADVGNALAAAIRRNNDPNVAAMLSRLDPDVEGYLSGSQDIEYAPKGVNAPAGDNQPLEAVLRQTMKMEIVTSFNQQPAQRQVQPRPPFVPVDYPTFKNDQEMLRVAEEEGVRDPWLEEKGVVVIYDKAIWHKQLFRSNPGMEEDFLAGKLGLSAIRSGEVVRSIDDQTSEAVFSQKVQNSSENQ